MAVASIMRVPNVIDVNASVPVKTACCRDDESKHSTTCGKYRLSKIDAGILENTSRAGTRCVTTVMHTELRELPTN